MTKALDREQGENMRDTYIQQWDWKWLMIVVMMMVMVNNDVVNIIVLKYNLWKQLAFSRNCRSLKNKLFLQIIIIMMMLMIQLIINNN